MGLGTLYQSAAAANLWPLRPHPYPDELLSSWIARIAQANGVDFKCVLSEIWPRQKTPGPLLEVDPPSEILSVLAQRSGLPPEHVHHLVLSELIDPIYKSNPRKIQERLDYVPRALRSVLSHRNQFCPDCLATDPIPYFRRSWRLSAVTACSCHGRLLIEWCWNCHRESRWRLPVWLRCKEAQVSRSRKGSCTCTLEPAEKASPLAIRLQDRLLTILRRKSFRPDPVMAEANLSPVDLHFLVEHLLSKRTVALQFQDRLKTLAGDGPNREWSPTGHPRQALGHLTVRKRHAFMDAAAWALELGPHRTGMPIHKATLAGKLRYRIELDRRNR
ncbi:TniQ family protein [Geothrix limicola]